MDYAPAEPRPPSRADHADLLPMKILVAGGFGVGKTTLVRSLSEIAPLSTEQEMTSLSDSVDDLAAVPDKTTTTVAMDFGRITVDEKLVLYLFGTPGQARFWFMWDELSRGAVGAVVLVDLRRVDDSFAAIDYFENRGVPFVVALNTFPDTARFPEETVREALVVPAGCPLVRLDARDDASCTAALVTLVEHAVARSVPAGQTALAE